MIPFICFSQDKINAHQLNLLVEKFLAFFQTLANSINQFLFKLSVGMGAFEFTKELFTVSVLLKRSHQVKSEEKKQGEINIALTNLTQFMWKKLRITSLLIQKASEVIEVVFKNVTNLSIFRQNKLWIKSVWIK